MFERTERFFAEKRLIYCLKDVTPHNMELQHQKPDFGAVTTSGVRVNVKY